MSEQNMTTTLEKVNESNTTEGLTSSVDALFPDLEEFPSGHPNAEMRNAYLRAVRYTNTD